VSAPDRLGPRLEDVERLIQELEQGPESPARARARQLVGAVLDLHAGALARALEIVAGAGAAGPTVLDALTRDPLVAGVLLLHGLHPVDLESRVRAAADELAPTLRGQGALLAGLDIADGSIRVRLERDPARHAVSASALRATVEQALLAAAPDAIAVEVVGPDPGEHVAFVPVEQVRLRPRAPEARRA